VTYIFLAILAVLAVIGFSTGSVAQPAGDSGQDSGDTSGNSFLSSLEATVGVTVNPAGASTPTGTAVSDGSLTGAVITSDPSTWPGAQPAWPNASIWDICTAVALAEGYNQGPGAAPYDLNNPGDLSPGDEAGQATAGPPQSHGGSSIIFFATCEGGFIALYTKFFNMASGNSIVYPRTWTWAQVAAKYAGNSAAWLANVTNYLGVDSSSTPAQYAGLA
jgi:hypothetical protein